MKIMQKVAILSAVRTPIGKFGGSLASRSAVELGVEAVRAALQRARIEPDEVDMLVLGLARQAGCGPNPGRQVAVRSGIPVRSVAYTLNQACASGLASVLSAQRHIHAGEAEIVVAAGAESMSNVPYMLPKVRFGQKMGHQKLVDAMYQDGLHCPLADQVMGQTVEALAREFSITREQQDEYALECQRRAGRAPLAEERISLPQLDHDEHMRADTSAESLRCLGPVFAKDGTITAGNSSGITDGASALVVCSLKAAERLGTQPIGYLEGGATVGLEPERMGLGPVFAVQALSERLGRREFDLIEINEAFAAQVLACKKHMDLPLERTNVNGGAIALGHPIGCSGNRIAVTLLHEMRRRQAQHGLATLCVSGGLGIAASFSLQ